MQKLRKELKQLTRMRRSKFSSDRTIEEYAKEIWHLDKVKVEVTDAD